MRILVPERGEPTTKIGLFSSLCIFREDSGSNPRSCILTENFLSLISLAIYVWPPKRFCSMTFPVAVTS